MQGKVLGVDATGGVITGEDGKRYRFDLAQWKGARAPLAGEAADFEAVDGSATEVYPVRAGAAPALNVDLNQFGAQAREALGAGAASPAAAQALSLVKGDLKVQLALAVIVASLFLNYLVIGGGGPGAMMSMALPHGGKFTVAGMGSAIDYASQGLKTAAAGLEGVSRYSGGMGGLLGADSPYAAEEAAEMAKVKQKVDDLKIASSLLKLLYILYLIPLGAAALLVQAYRGKQTGLIALGVGVLSAAAFPLLLFGKSGVVATVDSMTGGMGGPVVANLIHAGLGAYVLLVAGVALAAAAVGLLRLPAALQRAAA
jgi:hypothetical protein